MEQGIPDWGRQSNDDQRGRNPNDRTDKTTVSCHRLSHPNSAVRARFILAFHPIVTPLGMLARPTIDS